MIRISKPLLDLEEKDAVLAVLNSGMIVQGSRVAKLEKEFTELCRSKFSIATNNGTSALHTAFYAAGVGSGDEVITTPFTFIASANSIIMSGAKPVFVDIDEKTFNIDTTKIEKAITKKTKAILTVNIFGQPVDYNEVNHIAKKYSLIVIEDAAQSINASYKNRKSGNLADISCFSLYATKNIMTGEGGMITTNNKFYFEKARLFRHHGQSEKIRYKYVDIGYNYRMTDLHAAIGLAQLKKLDKLTKKRQSIAKKYDNALKGIKGLLTPYIAENRNSVFHQYTLRVTKDYKVTRDELLKYLEKKDIQSTVYYPNPLHKIKHLSSKKQLSLPIAEQAAQEVLSIPVHPLLKDEEVEYIINTIKNI